VDLDMVFVLLVNVALLRGELLFSRKKEVVS